MAAALVTTVVTVSPMTLMLFAFFFYATFLAIMALAPVTRR